MRNNPSFNFILGEEGNSLGCFLSFKPFLSTMKYFTLLLLAFANCLSAQVWQPKSADLPINTSKNGIVAPSPDVAWVFGTGFDQDYIFTDYGHSISRTINGGQTWQAIHFPHTEPGYFSNITAISADVAWISYVDYADGNLILKTMDSGQTWVSQTHGITAWINVVHFWDGTNGMAMGDPGPDGWELFTSVNGGEYWDQVSQSDIPPALPGEFGYSNSYQVNNNEVWFETNTNRIFYSANKGHSWQVITGPQPDLYSSFKVDNNGMCFIMYVSTNIDGADPLLTIYRSSDNGTNWENITPADNGWWIYDMTPVKGTNTIIGSFNRGRFSNIFETRLSYDQGLTWVTIDTTSKTRALQFPNAQSGYANLYSVYNEPSPDVAIYTGSPLSGLFDQKPLDVNILLSPNPTADFVNLELTSENPGIFLVLLNDASGHLLYKSISDKTTRYQSPIDMRQLPAGVYNLTISSKDGMVTKQIVKQ